MLSQSIPDNMNVATALANFYAEHGLGDKGGEDDRWAKVKFGWLAIYIPNPEIRKRALFFHDVHHLATSFQTDLRGEAEIGAWEIASGCRDYWAAWVLNFLALNIGLVISPARTFRAFVRGRHTCNLYDESLSRDTIGQMTVGMVRQKLGLDKPPRASMPADKAIFFVWSMPLVLAALAVIAGFARFSCAIQ